MLLCVLSLSVCLSVCLLVLPTESGIYKRVLQLSLENAVL